MRASWCTAKAQSAARGLAAACVGNLEPGLFRACLRCVRCTASHTDDARNGNAWVPVRAVVLLQLLPVLAPSAHAKASTSTGTWFIIVIHASSPNTRMDAHTRSHTPHPQCPGTRHCLVPAQLLNHAVVSGLHQPMDELLPQTGGYE